MSSSYKAVTDHKQFDWDQRLWRWFIILQYSGNSKTKKVTINPKDPTTFQCYLYTRGCVLRGFANSQCRPNNEDTSLAPFNGLEHQNCSTPRTSLRVIRHDVAGAEGIKEAAIITMFLHERQKLKFLNCWWIFVLRRSSWNLIPRKATDECILKP